MSHEHPGPVRKLALLVFRVSPMRLVWPAVRLISPTFTMGAIALIEYDGKLLALRQTHRKGVSLPGGMVEKGEHPATAVVREVLEETGIRIDPGDVAATTFETTVRHIDVIFRVVCDTEPTVHVASEATSYEWLPADQWNDVDNATQRILDALEAAHRQPRVGAVLTSPDDAVGG
ncbi:NUDIX domain-containing protein [Flexivirga oryzae]|uniref:8-oxo-dGTP pyrophosphatase MutT (NUDIX family) n=1 Tax=Flexivirga oryzae TaxID=1794944 RepID=A0A839NFN4_9MICO|nr:NUDIX domain-containing protein [Flexivirga oryzae]MBB2893302.1 8-oxo-dGTP pyrophosphatase MutT (NUDIX family) [Flexivirga oryzae]